MKNTKYFKYALFGIALSSALIGCEDNGYDEYDAGNAPTQALNGEWIIDISDMATGDLYVSHALHRTYDPGDDSGRMIISDRVPGADPTSMEPSDFTGWMLEGYVNVNVSDLTFDATNEFNVADESHFTITNGKIFKKATPSAAGVMIDSIYFEGTFDYDPETTLMFAGHKRTGFPEDE